MLFYDTRITKSGLCVIQKKGLQYRCVALECVDQCTQSCLIGKAERHEAIMHKKISADTEVAIITQHNSLPDVS